MQNADYVMILTEMIHDVRIIPLDGRPPLPQGVRQLLGSSRGRWEGDTLVVETTNFTDRTAFQGSSENLHVTERFTRVSADTLQYEFTVEGSLDVGSSLVGGRSDGGDHRPDIRIRLPRGKLRPGEQPGRRSGEEEKAAAEAAARERIAITCERDERSQLPVRPCSSPAVPAWAHHAFSAEFDAKKPVMLQGKVTKGEIGQSPLLDSHRREVGPDGKVVNWMIEGGSPNALIRQGITKNSLPIGTELRVDGYRSKDGANKAVGKDVTLADGRKLFFGGSAPPAPGAP